VNNAAVNRPNVYPPSLQACCGLYPGPSTPLTPCAITPFGSSRQRVDTASAYDLVIGRRRHQWIEGLFLKKAWEQRAHPHPGCLDDFGGHANAMNSSNARKLLGYGALTRLESPSPYSRSAKKRHRRSRIDVTSHARCWIASFIRHSAWARASLRQERLGRINCCSIQAREGRRFWRPGTTGISGKNPRKGAVPRGERTSNDLRGTRITCRAYRRLRKKARSRA